MNMRTTDFQLAVGRLDGFHLDSLYRSVCVLIDHNNFGSAIALCAIISQRFGSEQELASYAHVKCKKWAKVYSNSNLDNFVPTGDYIKDTVAVCLLIKNSRTEETIIEHLAGELLELEEELHNSLLLIPQGSDGIFGEAIDVILCLIDYMVTIEKKSDIQIRQEVESYFRNLIY